MKSIEYLQPDDSGNIHINDNFEPLFNHFSMQYGLVDISGKSPMVAEVHRLQQAQRFFSENRHLLEAPIDDLDWSPVSFIIQLTHNTYHVEHDDGSVGRTTDKYKATEFMTTKAAARLIGERKPHFAKFVGVAIVEL